MVVSPQKLSRLRRVISILLAAIAFCAFLYFNPAAYRDIDEIEVNPSDITIKSTQTKATSLLAKDVLESLAVREKDTSAKYYRKLFYDDWSTAADGCNMREAILKRDLKNIVLKGCKVQSGTLADPYTGQQIDFVRGQDTSANVQIDHVVALSNAWATGAYAFDEQKRYAISQDPLNLLAVEGQANQDKLDQDAANWLPPNVAFRCQYVARQISVKYKYELWVTPAEKAAMLEILAKCPDEPTLGLEDL